MKTVLLIKSFRKIALITFLSTGLFSFAQTISPVGSLPASSEVGSVQTLNFNYTSPVKCVIVANLFLFNIDGNNVITPDWDGLKAGGKSGFLPVTAKNVQQAVSVSLPADLVLSSNLPAGKIYVWVYQLETLIGGSIPWGRGQDATTIIASTAVLDILKINNPVTSISAGSTITISVDYTLAGPRLIKLGISKFNTVGTWIEDLVVEGIDNLPGTTTTPVTLTRDLVIPSNAVISANLQDGEYYQIDTAIFGPGYAGLKVGKSAKITITAGPLGVEEFSKNSFKIFPNPVANKLFLNDDFESVKVYDLSGKKVIQLNNASENSVDVSQLKKGTYILVSDTNKKAKFIKE
jgi:hypothetical protein